MAYGFAKRQKWRRDSGRVALPFASRLNVHVRVLPQRAGVVAPQRPHLFREELVHLLRRPADEAARVEDGHPVKGGEGRVRLQPVQQVVSAAFLQLRGNISSYYQNI